MVQKIGLNGSYKLQCFDFEEDTSFLFRNDFVPEGWLDADVPVDVRTVLRSRGLISGHYYGKDLDAERWIDEKNWIYYRRFYVDAALSGKRNLLRFEGVDTLAEVYLNGELLGGCANMFIPHSFDVGGKLNYGGDNTLAVKILSPVKSIEDVDRTGLFPAEDTGRLLLRKSQMNYGWDFCGHCLTAGIWKDVFLCSIDEDALSDVFLHTDRLENGSAFLTAELELTAYPGSSMEAEEVCIRFRDGQQLVLEKRIPAKEKCSVELELEDPLLWWPRPYGEPHLYDVEVLLTREGKTLDSRRFWFGVRTARLLQEELPEGGRGFLLEVNGREIFVRGANWVPLNCVYAEIKDADYDPFIRRAIDANLSMLRVWGGGIYESEHFFDLCDENGILVFQDFMLACGVLPQGEDFLRAISEEVEIVARQFRNRASLVLWSADNELDEAYRWYDILPQFKTNKVNRVAVRNAIAKADPTRSFLVSSPCSPFEEEEGGDDPNSPLQGDMHVYLTRFTKDSEYYYKKLTEFVPRFMSEYGFSSLPSLDSYQKFNFFGEALDLERNPWLGQLPEFGPIKRENNMERMILATQYTHAAALKYWIEYMRSHRPVCGGSLYWKFNDPIAPNREDMLFPTMMSSVDFFGKTKLAYYYSRRAYEDIILAFREEPEEGLCLFSCNETDREYNGVLTVETLTFSGELLLRDTLPVCIGADASRWQWELSGEAMAALDKASYIRAVFQGDGLTLVNRWMSAEIAEWFHLEPSAARLSVTLQRIGGGELAAEITAGSFAQDVTLDILDVDAYYSDNCFSMDAGEKRVIQIHAGSDQNCYDRCLKIGAQNQPAMVFGLNAYVR